MKTILSLLATVTVLNFAIPSSASADHGHNRRVVSYLPCGRPVFAHYEVCGFNRHGQPVGHWETERVSCGCAVCNPRAVHRPVYSPQACDHRHAYTRPRVGFFFSFGR